MAGGGVKVKLFADLGFRFDLGVAGRFRFAGGNAWGREKGEERKEKEKEEGGRRLWW